ncbi:hypothetical protein ETU08_07600 [Apibacter muscae]|uniref:hypothetical protein n=1 Tax=Apibacter muscae TaxID=2509004 RepID=UPI0011ABCF45|nr:hypothetical protein [Apibacter muscae]TWP29356.1 hypothetical protein ETU08_07600 [Apibacter muscae]
MDKKDFLGYKVDNIYTSFFQLKDLKKEEVKELFTIKDRLELTIRIAFIADYNNGTMNVGVVIMLTDREKHESVLHHVVNTTFGILGLNTILDTETQELKIPKEMMLSLLSISFSHARAVSITSLGNTPLNGYFVLPVVGVNTLKESLETGQMNFK